MNLDLKISYKKMGSPNQNTKLKDTSTYNSILTNGNKNQ
jgi:hypothetical protein